MEYREFRAEDVTVDDDGKLHGVALPFNSVTTIGDLKRGGWREEAAPGLTRKSLQEGDVLFLAHHDMHMPLARMSAGNLALRETGENLRYEVDPADTSYGRDIRALAKAKVLGGVSIGFQPIKDEWRDDDGNPSDRLHGTHRILREIKLIEISAVTNPAYKDTSIMARDELLAEREARADQTADLPRMEQRELDLILDMIFEDRAGSVSEADRKALAAKGHALPDGSYPIPDIAHLHAAAVLAASHHGDWKAAKVLIRKRARELGVSADSLPGMGVNDGDKPEGNRDDDAIDTAIRQLQAGDVEGAQKTLAAHEEQRTQEPDASTPDQDDADFALIVRERERSRERHV